MGNLYPFLISFSVAAIVTELIMRDSRNMGRHKLSFS